MHQLRSVKNPKSSYSSRSSRRAARERLRRCDGAEIAPASAISFWRYHGTRFAIFVFAPLVIAALLGVRISTDGLIHGDTLSVLALGYVLFLVAAFAVSFMQWRALSAALLDTEDSVEVIQDGPEVSAVAS